MCFAFPGSVARAWLCVQLPVRLDSPSFAPPKQCETEVLKSWWGLGDGCVKPAHVHALHGCGRTSPNADSTRLDRWSGSCKKTRLLRLSVPR